MGIASPETGCWVAVNPALCRILKCTEDQLLRTPVFDLIHPDDLDRANEQMARVMSGASDITCEHRVRRSDGGYCWIDWNAVRGVDGLIYCVGRDITAQKDAAREFEAAEAHMRAAGEQFRVAMESACMGTWDYRPKSGELRWDERCRELLNVAAGVEVNYPLFLACLHPDDRQRVDDAVRAAITPGETGEFDAEYRVPLDDGKVRWIASKGRAWFEQTGSQVVRFVGTVRDITVQKRTEADLARQAQELARSNSDLQQFAYVTSHDLQEPIRGMTAFSQILMRRYSGVLDEQGIEFLRHIVASADRMQGMIQSLLAYSRVVNAEPAPRVPFPLESAVRWAMMNLTAAVAESGAVITFDNLPYVDADQVQIAQVFQNLLSNAIKYRSKDVPPRIHIEAEERASEWIVAVRDNGIGIASVFFEKIFGVFKRLHGNDIPGAGIGLALCRKIVERNGGRIWLESEPGAGSTFYFTIPC